MNVYLRELHASWRGFLVWAAVLVFFVAVGTYKFTGMQGASGEQSMQLLESFPRPVLAMFGLAATNAMEFGGFFAMIEFYAVIIVAAWSVGAGVASASREVTDGTGEFLYTMPVTRGRVLAGKLFAALTLLVGMGIANAASAAGAFLALGSAVEGIDAASVILAGTAWVVLAGLIFLALGAALAAVLPNGKLASQTGMTVLALAYAASVALDLFGDKAGWIRALSPIRYVGMDDVASGVVTAGGAAALVALSATLFALAFHAFSRRDL